MGIPFEAASTRGQGFGPVTVRQGEVQQDDVDPGLAQLGEGACQPVGMDELESTGACLRQELPQEARIARVVLDQENVCEAAAPHLVQPLPLTGRTTMPSQKSSMDRTTLTNCSKSTGFVIKQFA